MLSHARVPTVEEQRTIPVCADPCGVAYDPSTDVLYVADAYSGAIDRVERDQQSRIATIEAGTALAGDRIGGLARAPHGTLFATVIGGGRAGAVVRIEPDGSGEPLDGLPVTPRRLGVTYDAHEHALYTTQHLASRRGPHDGSIVAIDLVTGTPSTVLDGFARPVGIAKLGSLLVVTDARQRAVFRIELVAGRAVRRLQLAGEIDRPDSVCACGADSVLVTAYDDETRCGSVHRIWLDGRRAAVIARGPWEPRGIATDGWRVFVAARRAGRVLVFDL